MNYIKRRRVISREGEYGLFVDNLRKVEMVTESKGFKK